MHLKQKSHSSKVFQTHLWLPTKWNSFQLNPDISHKKTINHRMCNNKIAASLLELPIMPLLLLQLWISGWQVKGKSIIHPRTAKVRLNKLRNGNETWLNLGQPELNLCPTALSKPSVGGWWREGHSTHYHVKGSHFLLYISIILHYFRE